MSKNTTDTRETQQISFQPTLKITHTEQIVIGHQNILKITHTRQTIALSDQTDSPTDAENTEKPSYTPHLRQAHHHLDTTFQNHIKKKQEEKTPQNESAFGLDCSGQGMCQPDINPSDHEKMQKILIKAKQNKLKNKIKNRLKSK